MPKYFYTDPLIYENGRWIGLGYAICGYDFGNRNITQRNGKVFFVPEVEQ